MVRYIMPDPHIDDLVSREARLCLVERPRLLLQLLSDRRRLRVLCAPALFGKTVVAAQYAQLAFSLENVRWVRANDPLFLCDLDAKALESRFSDCGSGTLVVFDDVAALGSARTKLLGEVVASLLSERCEVLLTTRSREVASGIAPNALVLDAADLMLDAGELASSPSARVFHGPGSGPLLAPVAYFDVDAGVMRFCHSLVAPRELDSIEALALTALLLGSGSIEELGKLCLADGHSPTGGRPPMDGHSPTGGHPPRNGRPPVDEHSARNGYSSLASVERDFPYAGIRRRSATFEAANIPVSQRAGVLESHLDALVHFSPYATEAEYLRALVDSLTMRGELTLARFAIQRYFDDAQRKAFCRDHGIKSFDELVDAEPGAPWEPEAAAELLVMREMQASPAPEQSLVAAGKPYEVSLFGRFDIWRDGRRVPERGEVRKMGKLLIALLLVNHGQDVSREWIEHVIWPKASEAASHSSYYNLWSYVRRLFTIPVEGAVRLPRSRTAISLSGANIRSDVEAFDRLFEASGSCGTLEDWRRVLDAAVGLYRGPLLPGIENVELEAYRSTYQARMVELLLRGVDEFVRQGQLSSALRYARRAFEVDPTREDVCYRYMELQKRLGQFAGAITSFLGCRRALVERFGFEGSRRLDRLYREILEEMS